MNAFTDTAELEAGVEQVTRESGGALDIVVVMKDEIPKAMEAALSGDAVAVQVMQMAMQSLDRIGDAPRHEPMLCAVCPQALRLTGRFSLALAIPACDDPGQALGLAICGKCASDPATVQVKAIEALRGIWPSLRTATITHPAGGRA